MEKGFFFKTWMTTEVQEVFCLMALMGGVKSHITLTAEFCGTKRSRGGKLVETTGSGETGVTQEERRIVLCIDWHVCVLTHPRDRWEIKRRRKQRVSGRFWTGGSSYCTFPCRVKSAIRGTFFKPVNRREPLELLHRSSGSNTERSSTRMGTCVCLRSYNNVRRKVLLIHQEEGGKRADDEEQPVCAWRGSECVAAFLPGRYWWMMEVKRMMGGFPLRVKWREGALGSRRPASARPAVWWRV